MPISDAKKRADIKWKKANYEQMNLSVPIGTKARFTEAASKHDMSMTAYVVETVEERIQREGATAPPTYRTNEFTRTAELFDLPAAAGSGEYLDGNSFTLVNIDENVPRSANFGVRISGDSMLPDYPHGYIAWVRRSVDIDHGKIGVFMLDGNGYIKKMGRGELLSLNPEYEPITLTEYSDIRFCGVVVGVTDDVYS
jgi:phage repressor protein C with HTH and peptisase S24 domain